MAMVQLIIEQFIYFGFLQCLFLIIIFLFTRREQVKVNGYITVFVFTLFVGLLGRVLFQSGFLNQDYRLIILSEFSILLFGPTIFLFTKSSITDQKVHINDLIHYSSAVFYDIALVFLYVFPSQSLRKAYEQPMVLFYVIIVMSSIALAVNGIYINKSIRVFNQFKAKLQDELSFSVKIAFLRNFHLSAAIMMIYWTGVFIATIIHQQRLSQPIYDTVWLSISFLILIIGYYCLKDPEAFKISNIFSEKRKYKKSKLRTEELSILKDKLNQLMKEKEPYLNKNLIKAELAEMLGVSNPEMARLLNEKIGMNFFEYINYYRIIKFIELVQTQNTNHLTFFAIAQEAGFNSKSTFNKSFKQIMGKTPREYLSGLAT